MYHLVFVIIFMSPDIILILSDVLKLIFRQAAFLAVSVCVCIVIYVVKFCDGFSPLIRAQVLIKGKHLNDIKLNEVCNIITSGFKKLGSIFTLEV